MKKILLSACILAVTIISAHAQSFNLGIKAGINSSKLSTDFAKEENRLGYQVGLWARLGAAGIYVQPEAYLGSKGGKFTAFDDGSGEQQADAKVNFTTLDIPVLIGTKIGFDKANLRFMAGPVISFNLDKDRKFGSAYDQATDIKNYKNQAWGGQLGAGVDLGSFSVDIRYEAGLSNISKSDTYDQKTNLWHFSLGYKLF